MKTALSIALVLSGLSGAAAANHFVCPKTGGTLVAGLETHIDTLDLATSGSTATRDIALNILETLVTLNGEGKPALELARRLTVSSDDMTFTFVLRTNVSFHNGHRMTSADVAASFDRYRRVGRQAWVLDAAAGWTTPDPDTFVIRTRIPAPFFIDTLASMSSPIVIVPAENRDVPAGLLTAPPGTGPFELDESAPGDHVRIKRFGGFAPNPLFDGLAGLTGYKQACLDSVTFRFVPDPDARAAGLKSGELDLAEDLDGKDLSDLARDRSVTVWPAFDRLSRLVLPNLSAPPTDSLVFRRAVWAALDFDEILDAVREGQDQPASGGIPLKAASNPDESPPRARSPELAKSLLARSGYGGEPVVLLIGKEDTALYSAALVMQQQMQAAGINARMKIVDQLAAARMTGLADSGWNFYFSGLDPWHSERRLDAIRPFPIPLESLQPKGVPDDSGLMAAWRDIASRPAANRAGRAAALSRLDVIVQERIYTIPLGSIARNQGVSARVKGFTPFVIPRFSNVWLSD